MNIRLYILIVSAFIIAKNALGQEETDFFRLNLQPQLKTLGRLTNDDFKAPNLNDLIVSDTLHLDLIESKPYLKNMNKGSLNHTESSFQPLLLSNLNETQALGLRGNYTNYGFEGARSVGLYFKSDIGDKISLMVNPYVASYFSGPHNLSPVIGSAIQLNFNYQLSDRILIKGRGQYAPNATNKDFYPSLLSPQNSFGGSVTFKINDNFGIEAGMDCVYHMGKWEPVYYIGPVFYSKKNR